MTERQLIVCHSIGQWGEARSISVERPDLSNCHLCAVAIWLTTANQVAVKESRGILVCTECLKKMPVYRGDDH